MPHLVTASLKEKRARFKRQVLASQGEELTRQLLTLEDDAALKVYLSDRQLALFLLDQWVEHQAVIPKHIQAFYASHFCYYLKSLKDEASLSQWINRLCDHAVIWDVVMVYLHRLVDILRVLYKKTAPADLVDKLLETAMSKADFTERLFSIAGARQTFFALLVQVTRSSPEAVGRCYKALAKFFKVDQITCLEEWQGRLEKEKRNPFVVRAMVHNCLMYRWEAWIDSPESLLVFLKTRSLPIQMVPAVVAKASCLDGAFLPLINTAEEVRAVLDGLSDNRALHCKVASQLFQEHHIIGLFQRADAVVPMLLYVYETFGDIIFDTFLGAWFDDNESVEEAQTLCELVLDQAYVSAFYKLIFSRSSLETMISFLPFLEVLRLAEHHHLIILFLERLLECFDGRKGTLSEEIVDAMQTHVMPLLPHDVPVSIAELGVRTYAQLTELLQFMRTFLYAQRSAGLKEVCLTLALATDDFIDRHKTSFLMRLVTLGLFRDNQGIADRVFPEGDRFSVRDCLCCVIVYRASQLACVVKVFRDYIDQHVPGKALVISQQSFLGRPTYELADAAAEEAPAVD